MEAVVEALLSQAVPTPGSGPWTGRRSAVDGRDLLAGEGGAAKHDAQVLAHGTEFLRRLKEAGCVQFYGCSI
jgi:hypothetical protein